MAKLESKPEVRFFVFCQRRTTMICSASSETAKLGTSPVGLQLPSPIQAEETAQLRNKNCMSQDHKDDDDDLPPTSTPKSSSTR